MSPRVSLPSLLRPLALALLALPLSSCKDDPELVRKREEQRAEMNKLDGELKILQEKLDQIPRDRSSELTKLQRETEDNKASIETLEREVASLEGDKAAVEKELAAYKRKYALR